jgi:hypothetical protein
MAELGETNDPRELVPGDANQIRASTVHLTVYGDTMIRIGQGFQRLDSGGWTGPAADAFHKRAETEPGRWLTAGDAFGSAAEAINRYSDTLDWAQDQAWQAISLWNKAEETTRAAQAQHDQQTKAAQQQAGADGQPAPPEAPFTDPGEADRARARGMLDTARANLVTAGDQAVAQVDRAQQDAPEERTFLDNYFSDFNANVNEQLGEITGNLVDGVGDITHGALHDVVGETLHYFDGVGAGISDIGDLIGSQDLKDAGATVTSSMDDAANAVDHAGDAAQQWVHQRGVDARTFLSGVDPGPRGPHYLIIDQGEYPEAADHVREAQMGTSWRGDEKFPRTQPSEVTIDRDGATGRRAESMKQVPQTKPGYDRDEYPPAMFKEGGTGSSVKYIDPHDNQGAGSSMGRQVAGLDDGAQVTILAD